MDTRETIENILDAAYAARQRQDHEAAAACFTEDGCFKANGGLGTGSAADLKFLHHLRQARSGTSNR
jgi:hypothetical protein